MTHQIQFRIKIPRSSRVFSESDGRRFPDLFDREGSKILYKDASEISPHLGNKCSSYHSILQDLSHSQKLLELCRSMPSTPFDEVAPSLLLDAVITYGRCFSQGEVRNLKISPSKPWILGSEEKTLHVRLINTRNTLFAHVGANPLRKSETLILLDSPDNPTKFNLLCRQRRLNNLSSQENDEIIHHICKVQARVYEKLEGVSSLLVKDVRKKLKLKHVPGKFSHLSD